MEKGPSQGEILDSAASTSSSPMTALKIYLQGLVVALFGMLFYVMFLLLPHGYGFTGSMVTFVIASYVLGAVNSKISRRFWIKHYRFSNLTILGQGAILLFITMIVLACTTSVYVIQMVGGPQVDPFFQIRLGLWTTLISPPFYGILARSVATWKIKPLNREIQVRASLTDFQS